MRTWVAQAWRGWTGLATHIGDFQARGLLTLVYFTWLAPFAVLVRVLRDPLDTRGGHKSVSTTAWKARLAQGRNLQALRRQF